MLLASEIDGIKILSRYPYFTFQVGHYRVSPYCAGHSAEADISESFPHNRTRAPAITERNQYQLRLPFQEALEPDDSNCEEIILADIGNPNDGLCKVFLGVPIETAPDGHITKWGTTIEIWSSDSAMPFPTTSPSGNIPPVENVAPPEIRLRDDKKEKKSEEE